MRVISSTGRHNGADLSFSTVQVRGEWAPERKDSRHRDGHHKTYTIKRGRDKNAVNQKPLGGKRA